MFFSKPGPARRTLHSSLDSKASFHHQTPASREENKPTVLVTLDGTDLATLPSQCWFTRLARKIPQKKTSRRGRGAGEGHFRLGCEVSQLNLTNTVFRKNFKYAVFNIKTLAGKTGHFFRAVEVDCHDIVPFKFTKLRVIFIVAGNNNNY